AYPSLSMDRGARARYPEAWDVSCPCIAREAAEHTVLHQVVAEHLEAFLASVAEAGDGVGVPQFVEREFRKFLTCGVFEHGVARFRCEGCGREHLVPFSCKGRAWCPSAVAGG